MIGHPQRSPSFPYSPLFRLKAPADLRKWFRRPLPLFSNHSAEDLFKAGKLEVVAAKVDQMLTGDFDPLSQQPDRKSTRLNSSHANISYAVFCLKKTR